ncbi:methanogenesis marker 14 protein [Methanococcus voltae]|uniref:Methanogenesis marker protein 14 n=1 Tax=Methanococcus voltae (strain ATCC BAA-1334 / A3) TaxID=456320 RepID=D7DTB3_METV3|nr:methanogenesis marker 14 protein [Methanococcus voltae]MCS3901224.1 putative methanogenesis marker protein 14 [Methanococcus voltae]
MGIMDSIKSIFKKSVKVNYSMSKTVDLMDLNPRQVGPNQHVKPYYVVASVELGNTTTKAIITATDMEEGITYLVSKDVRMTRDVRVAKKDENVFGTTIWGIELTKEAVSDMVKDVLVGALEKAHLTPNDIDFVVRSTGVTAGFASPEEVGNMIVALAQGCRNAGIPNSKMTPIMTKKQLPERLQKYCLVEKVMFDGAVTGVVPPKGKEAVANEMEGELVTAGLKSGAKWTEVDFRNPCISIDFGTTLAGRVINDELPYAKVVGNLCGLAGAIPDAIVRGTGLVSKKGGAVLDIQNKTGKINKQLAEEYCDEFHKLISVERVPNGRTRYGTVPLDTEAAEKAGTYLIGCDVGDNGSDLIKLEEIGKELYEKSNINTMLYCLDLVSAKVACRVIKIAKDNGLVNEKSAVGITGRAGITGQKPEVLIEMLKALNIWDNPNDHVVFVEDGLALGAGVMARCMNCLGTPKHPIGGNRGGACILKQRIQRQKR